MYQVMIIDDNYLSVEGIRHNINWTSMDACVSQKVYDGQTALEILEKEQVDLIISDIEMAQLNGLEMAEKALRINPSIKIILISAFDKFEYARQAIRLGAFDYVEKPLDYTYLSSIIEKALHTLQQERHNLDILNRSKPAMIENFFSELIHSSSDEARYSLNNYPDYLNLKLDYHYFQAAIIRIENADEVKSKFGIEEYHLRLMSLTDQIKESFCNAFSLVYILTNFNKLIVFLGHDYVNAKIFQSSSSELFSRLSDSLRGRVFEISIGIGTVIKYLWNMPVSYENASKALEYSFFFPQKNIFDIRDTKRKEIPSELFTSQNEEQLIQLICKKQTADIHDWIQKLSANLLENYGSKQLIFIQIYSLLGRLLKFMYEMDINTEETEHEIIDTYHRMEYAVSSSEIFQLLEEVCYNICQKLETSVQNHHAHICSATIEYIRTHYQDASLCLKDIADHVNVSPAHLSALFKKNQKQNISDVIANARIDAACQLLSNSSASLKEISARIGYTNQYYFSSCFKKKIGMTLSIYREKHLN